MWPSFIVYAGVGIALVALILVIRPIAWLRVRTRRRALLVLSGGVLLVLTGFLLPARERRVARAESDLDRIAPVWQFGEFHRLAVAAPPEVVFEAIERVRADEIRLFRALTWIRRGGRDLPQDILNAGTSEALLDVALRTGFVALAREAPRELVIGTVIAAPPDLRRPVTPESFLGPHGPGVTLAMMNFIVTPDGRGGSVVTTETRVFANNPAARRTFARYWRVIYPGSALIRRMWLRAIKRRAEG